MCIKNEIGDDNSKLGSNTKKLLFKVGVNYFRGLLLILKYASMAVFMVYIYKYF